MSIRTARPGLRAPVGIALAAALSVVFVAGGPTGSAAGDPAVAGPLASFDVGGVGGVIDFRFSYPQLFIPFVVTGGVLEATSLASSAGRAQGTAGVLPVPIATSAGLLIPGNDPVTGQPIPPQVRDALQSVNFSKFPNYCQSDYPPVAEGGDEAYCGGPAQEDDRLGFTAAAANGKTRSSGSSEDQAASRSVSEATIVRLEAPALQATVDQAWARSESGLHDGVPEGRAEVEIDGASLLGGLVRLQGLRSETIARSDGTKEGTVTNSTFALRSASVAGVPVLIGRDGVTVDEHALVPGESTRDASARVNDALKVNDVVIRLIPASAPEAQGGQVSAQSAGIEIVHRGTALTPADSIYRVGFSSARANAVAAGGDEGGSGNAGGTGLGGDSETSVPATADSLPDGSTDLAGASPEGSAGELPLLSSGADPAPSDAGFTADAGSLSDGSESLAAPSGAMPPAGAMSPAGAPATLAAIRGLPSGAVRRVFAGGIGLTLLVLAAWPARRLLLRGS